MATNRKSIIEKVHTAKKISKAQVKANMDKAHKIKKNG